MSIVPTGHLRSGITWMELFAKFELDGGSLDKPPQRIINIKTSFKPSYLLFEHYIRRVISMCADEDVRIAFTPCRMPGRRLAGFGLLSNFSSLNFLPCWEGAIPTQMHKAMLCMRIAPTTNTCKLIQQGFLKLVPRKPCFKGLPPWRKCCKLKTVIPEWWTDFCTGTPCAQSLPTPAEPVTPPPQYWLSCPECHRWTNCAKRKLLAKGKWGILECNACHLKRTASKWCCPCGTRWASCNIHAPDGLLCGTKPSCAKRARAQRRTTKPFFTLDQHGFPIDQPVAPKRVKADDTLEGPPEQTATTESIPIVDAATMQPLPIADIVCAADTADHSRGSNKRKFSFSSVPEVTIEPELTAAHAPAASPVQSPPPCLPPYPQMHDSSETEIPRKGIRYTCKTTHPVSMGGPPCALREHELSRDIFVCTNSCGSGDLAQPVVSNAPLADADSFAPTRRKRRRAHTGPMAQRKRTAKDIPLLAAVERLREARDHPIS